MSAPPWLIVILTGVVAQVTKFILYGLANRSLSLRVLVTANGLPSLYGMTFGCLATLVCLEQGHRSPLFVMTFILSGIVLHDSIRLRGSVDRGGQASLLVAQSLKDQQGELWLARLRPLLGDRRHRPLHVFAGIAWGGLLGLLFHPR